MNMCYMYIKILKGKKMKLNIFDGSMQYKYKSSVNIQFLFVSLRMLKIIHVSNILIIR